MSAQRWRQLALFGVLAVAIALSGALGKAWLSPDKAVPAAPTRRAVASPASVGPHLELERLQRPSEPATNQQVTTHAFGAMTWHVPPPPPPTKSQTRPLPPPPPTAPPMPFSFMGRYEEGGTRIILLVKGDRIYTVSEGDVIDSTYRVERMAAGQLELTYLPMNIKQTISAEGT